MTPRTITLLTIFLVIGVGILLILNALPMLNKYTSDKFISRNDVRGTAISHKKTLYTLNFDQQNALIDILNTSVPIAKSSTQAASTGLLDFDKIIFYQFEKSDIELTPIAYVDNNLVFSVPEWNPNGFLKENSNGALKKLLSQTFDP